MNVFRILLTSMDNIVTIESDEQELSKRKPNNNILNSEFTLLGKLNDDFKIENKFLVIKFKDYEQELKVDFTSDTIDDYISNVFRSSLRFLFLPESAINKSTLIVPIQNLQYIKFCTNNKIKMLFLNNNIQFKIL